MVFLCHKTYCKAIFTLNVTHCRTLSASIKTVLNKTKHYTTFTEWLLFGIHEHEHKKHSEKGFPFLVQPLFLHLTSLRFITHCGATVHSRVDKHLG